MANKSTKIEVNNLVNDIYQLLLDGNSRTQIALYAAEKWGVKMRTVDEYLSKARELQQMDAQVERPTWLLAAISRLQNYESKAAKSGQFQAANRAIELQARLLRFELS